MPREGRMVKSFSYSPNDEWIIKEIINYAERERLNGGFSEAVIIALKEFTERHGDTDPNVQQRLNDYGERGSRTTAFLKAEIVRYFLDRGLDVTYSEVVLKVKRSKIPKKRQIEEAESIFRELYKSKKVRVWR